MNKVNLGRTGIQASVMGLGCGGASRLGQGTGKTRAESVAVVRKALEWGVNFFDSAEAYGNEDILGEGLQGVPRDSVYVSTKKGARNKDGFFSAEDYRKGIEESLRRLKTDYMDVFLVHGLMMKDYVYAMDSLVPVLQKAKEQGKIRFLGVTEAFHSDPGHAMLAKAVLEEPWDVVMVGFNILNQSARDRVFAHTLKRNIGTLIMFAVRRAFSDPARLKEILEDLGAREKLTGPSLDSVDPFGFLVRAGGALSVTDAAYRFCRHEPGAHVVLSGTGNPEHLASNAASLNRPELHFREAFKLRAAFAGVDDVSGQ